MELQGQVLLPYPKKVEANGDDLLVDLQTAVVAEKALFGVAEVLVGRLQDLTGYRHRMTVPTKGRLLWPRPFRLELGRVRGEGSYELKITKEGVWLKGEGQVGVANGVQTLVQLLPRKKKPIGSAKIKGLEIVDWPSSERRIFHLDVSGHLLSTDDLKRVIGRLAFHKINELHLQLNGDAGWRMESLRFPQLHQVGSVRASTPPRGNIVGSDGVEYGGYYTQKNLREVVKEGERYGMMVVPAFSFQVGASAILASLPELGDGEKVEVATTWEPRKVGLESLGESEGLCGRIV